MSDRKCERSDPAPSSSRARGSGWWYSADANHEPGSTGHWCCRAVASCFVAALARSASISPRSPTKLSNLLQAPARPPRIDGALPDALAHRTQHLLRLVDALRVDHVHAPTLHVAAEVAGPHDFPLLIQVGERPVRACCILGGHHRVAA